MLEVFALVFILNLAPALPDACCIPVVVAWVDETTKVTLPTLRRVGSPIQCPKLSGPGAAKQKCPLRNWPCWFG